MNSSDQRMHTDTHTGTITLVKKTILNLLDNISVLNNWKPQTRHSISWWCSLGVDQVNRRGTLTDETWAFSAPQCESQHTMRSWNKHTHTHLVVGCWHFTGGHCTNVHVRRPAPVSHQRLSCSSTSAAHLQGWITGTLPSSCWVRGQGEVVLVSDPRFHHVYFFKVESRVHSCQGRLWKRKTILSLLPFF